jgi:hypothetical protein
MKKELLRSPAVADRVQVNVRLRRASMSELMRLAGLEQAVLGERVTQQDLVERAVDELVVRLRSKHARA